MEESILNWLEVGDAIQKSDVYNNRFRANWFKIFYNISKNMYFSEYLHYVLIIIFFLQIWELNISDINLENDRLLKIINFLQPILLVQKVVDVEDFKKLIIALCFFFLAATILLVIIIIALLYDIYFNILLKIFSFIDLLFIYCFSAPFLQIFTASLFIPKESVDKKDYFLLVIFVLSLIFSIAMLANIILTSLYMSDINTINGMDYKSKSNDNYMTIIIVVKMIYCILEQLIALYFVDNKTLLYGFLIILLLMNLIMSIYCFRNVYFYNNNINILHHIGWHYSTWISICVLFKIITDTKDMTLFLVIGFVLIIICSIFSKKYQEFKLLTEFNILADNKPKDIEMYCNLIFQLSKQNEPKSNTLLAGIIKRSEDCLKNNQELYYIYDKFAKKADEIKLFDSFKEKKILYLLGVIYANNDEKAKINASITLNRCYFIMKDAKNITSALFIATKINPSNHIEAYYKYVLLEQIKEYLINKMKKPRIRPTIKNLQLSKVFLYNQLVDLFKIEIYDATCSQIEYFDILKNNITTEKATENLLKTGESLLSLRKNIINIWDRMIELNPLDLEAERDYMVYLDVIVQDEFLKKEEIRKYKDKKEEFYTEKTKIYFDMFNQEKSAFLLCDGYSFNGKIFYYTPNFPSLFGFTIKEISNITIEDLLPDAIQVFHKYLVEESFKYTNMLKIFRLKRHLLLKGKNGLLFNINLYLRVLPNLKYGIIFILYIQKVEEKNFVIILDDKMNIDGFTESGQINSNFTVNNVSNYGLSQLAIGHHIGLIIPDILLQIDFDTKNEKYFFTRENAELKAYFYPTYNTKEMSIKIVKLLEIIKEKRMNEKGEDDKINPSDLFSDFIKEISSQSKKAYSIFYRIETRKFIEGKYRYFRIYITNDLLSENFNDVLLNTKTNLISNTDTNNKDNAGKIAEKLIKLKLNNKNNADNMKNEKINNNEESKNNNININNNEDLNINQNQINFSQPTSNSSSILSKVNKETNEFHKLKNEIINRKDFTSIKLIRFCVLIYILAICVLVGFDYYRNYKSIHALSDFLKQNLYFGGTKIACANTYSSALNIRLLKKEYINNIDCPNSNCTLFYYNLLVKSFTEIRQLKYDLNNFYQDYQDIFSKKMIVISNRYKMPIPEYYNLDIDNYLNFLIADGLKISANITHYYGNNTFFGFSSYEILDIYIDNLLNSSYNFFKSDLYNGFDEEEKYKRYKKYIDNIPVRLIIALAFFVVIIIFLIYIACRINSTEIFYLDKLINFSSNNFEDYLKKLDELKKTLRDETNDDEDKNLDDMDEDDMENKNENDDNKSLNKIKEKKTINKKRDDLKKRKNKQNKLHLLKLKKRKNMSNYFFKINCFFIIKISISFLLLVIYFLITILIFENYETNYIKFDRSVVEINSIYLNIFETYLNFKKQVEKFLTSNNEEDIKIPNDSDLSQPKLGNTLFDIIHNSKYTKGDLEKIKGLYNENVCNLMKNIEPNDKYCEILFSSLLTKGLDQAIVQMSIIINNCVDDLTLLKATKNLTNFYSIDNYYYNYEMLVGYYIFNSFLITKDIFDIFANDEIKYIINIQKAITIIYSLFIVIMAILCFYFVYDYKNIGNSFWNFIGILPNKFISDDESFYESIIKLGDLLY